MYMKKWKRKNILDERIKEIENGTAQYIKFEEVMSKTKYAYKRTPEEKEKEYKEYEQTAAKNEMIYKMLFGR